MSRLFKIARTTSTGVVGLALTLMIAGCNPLSNVSEKGEPLESRITLMSKNDPALAKASAEARRTFSIFKDSFERNSSNESATFSVKFPVKENDITEFFWLKVTQIVGNKIYGVHDCDGVDIKEVHPGLPASVMADEINDWILWDGKESKGGFSVFVIAKQSIAQINGLDVSTPKKEATSKQELLAHWKALESQAKANKPLETVEGDSATLNEILLIERLYKGNKGIDGTNEQIADICGLPPELVQAVNNLSEIMQNRPSPKD